MKSNEATLYGKGVYGINEWSIWSEHNVIHISGNGQRFTEVIDEGKAGRSIEEQVKLRIDARVRGKLDSGFKWTKENLNVTKTNQLGLAMPMLATPLENVRGFNKEKSYIQPKLDGHRCLINSDGAYSRRGKEIKTIPEIVKSLNIPSDITLDGELYCHGVPLQTIASWAKRRQADTQKLSFHIYDVIVPDLNFEERFNLLKSMINQGERIKLVDTQRYNPEMSTEDYWYKYRCEGYEGAIVRPTEGLYEIGIRSKKLIKIKLRQEEEFKCVDVVPSREEYGILVLETSDGKQFKTFAPGTYAQKMFVLAHRDSYVGKYVTVEYANLTDGGVPFHAIATRWRVDI